MAAKHKAPQADALELIATSISAILIGALVVFLVWDAFQPSEPAAFETTALPSTQRGDRLYVPVTVRNVGDEAARTVEVKVTVEGGPPDAEGRFTIDWMPGRSTRRGVAILPAEVVGKAVRAEVEGYSSP